MFIVKYRKVFYIFSLILVLVSIGAWFAWGLNLGVDFKGGSILEVAYPAGRPDVDMVRTELSKLGLGESVRPTGDNGYIIRMKSVTEPERVSVMNTLSQDGKVQVETKRFDSIGPLLGAEATKKAGVSIVLVIVCIVLFITFAFRHVSKPVSSWKYGIVAILALIHDIMIPTGAFIFLGHFLGTEMDTLFVTALLVVLGFSIHDTIVVFDRVRENLRHFGAGKDRKPFDVIVGESINQTFTRSINTSLTTLLALLVLYFLGPAATKSFSLALLIGIVAGTYSSVFLGSPLLVTLQKWQDKN